MRTPAAVLLTLLAVTAIGLIYVAATGLSARPTPSGAEVWIARRVRSLAVPRDYRRRQNPTPNAVATVAAGMAHFADHCAGCHGNDGRGDTAVGRGLYPRPPDLRSQVTQHMSDGALFYIIEHGVRLTGMPAFGDGTPEGEHGSWQLVRFIRHLPALSAEEIETMTALNPRSPEDIRREIEEDRFLQGKDVP